MNRLFLPIAIGALSILSMASCKKMTHADLQYNIATVYNPHHSSAFTLILDNQDSISVSETNFPWYRPETGQRILAMYSLLEKKRNKILKIKLNNKKTILTKDILSTDTLQSEDPGHDALGIGGMWISQDYLNIEFFYQGYNQSHIINLIRDNTKTDRNGTIGLQLRHNAQNDQKLFTYSGIACFRLASLKGQIKGNSVKLIIETNSNGGIRYRTIVYSLKNQPRLLRPVNKELIEGPINPEQGPIRVE